MPKKVKFEGKTYTVPDDASDEEIGSLLGTPASAPATSAERQIVGYSPGLHQQPIYDKPDPSLAQMQVGWAPAIGATVGALAGRGNPGAIRGGATLGAMGGSFLQTLLKSLNPDVFGKPPESIPGLWGKTAVDVLLNATIPHAIEGIGARVASGELASLPGLRSLPAVRQGVSKTISQKIFDQFVRPEDQVLMDAAGEAARRRQIQIFRPEGEIQFDPKTTDVREIPPRSNVPLQSTRTTEPGFAVDPIESQRYQEARFGQSAPYQPIRIVPGQEDLSRTVSKPPRMTAPSVQATGPVKENVINPNEMGQRLLQLQKDLSNGVDVMGTQNWAEIRRAGLSDLKNVKNLKLVAGQGATQDLAFNDLFGDAAKKTLDAKSVLDRLADPKMKSIWNEAITPEAMDSAKELLTQIQRQQEGHGASDTILRWSKNKFIWGAGSIGFYSHPISAGLALTPSAAVFGTNQLFEQLMKNQKYAQIVTKALTVPAGSSEAPMIAEALGTIFRGVGAKIQNESETKK